MMRGDASPSRRQRGVGGFTLVEVLVAMIIVGLTTPFLMGGLISGLARARYSQDRDAAAAWAQAEIEFLRAKCFVRLTPSSWKILRSSKQAGEPAPPPGFAVGHVRLESAGPAGLRATVSLHRQDWSGRDPAVPPFFTTSTYVADVRVAVACP